MISILKSCKENIIKNRYFIEIFGKTIDLIGNQ